jgi:hypothetical protein
MGAVGQRTGPSRRTAAGVVLSLAVHATLAWLLWRRPEARLVREERPVEIAVVEAPPAPPAPAPSPTGPSESARPTRRSTTRVRAPAPPTPSPGTGQESAPGDSHPLMRMRGGGIDLTPGADTLARALGPVEAPPADEKPRRRPRLPGTGLTTLEPELDDKVKLIHPRAFEVLTKVERLFRPDRQRTADEVAGDLRAGPSIKRWLFGSLANDPEALRNKVPTLACLVCVTLRPGVPPEVELSGPSGSPWFDSAATESLRRASVPERPDDALDPARACYRFSAKVWRTRPDLTNLAIPFKLVFSSKVQLVSYQKLGS